jgi:hypothetical protein
MTSGENFLKKLSPEAMVWIEAPVGFPTLSNDWRAFLHRRPLFN